MTVRRALGMLTLVAMMHFIIFGTAAACPTPRGDAAAVVSAHADCTPSPAHSKGGHTDRQGEAPCCAALASCATAPIATRTTPFTLAAPSLSVAPSFSERAPRADVPAPELPPPRA